MQLLSFTRCITSTYFHEYWVFVSVNFDTIWMQEGGELEAKSDFSDDGYEIYKMLCLDPAEPLFPLN